jgi:hypothetical protein
MAHALWIPDNYGNNIEILSECVLLIAFLRERVGVQQESVNKSIFGTAASHIKCFDCICSSGRL